MTIRRECAGDDLRLECEMPHSITFGEKAYVLG